MATKLVTNNFRIHTIRQLTESISEVANSVYYLFTANHLDDLSTTDAFDSPQQVVEDVYANMIVGKRVSVSDVAPLVYRYPWASATTYSMYDDTDIDLANKQFYVMVDEGSFNHVYKCLDNNNQAPSTVQPTFAHITGANADYYKTSDGYIWKYMYSFDSTANNKFGTDDFIPVIANNVVSAAAVDGQIDIVRVSGQGRKYDNYLTGTFGSGDISIGGNAQVFSISDNAKNSNGFYTGCVLYLSVGSGAGQFTTVQDYISNATGNFVVLANTFEETPTNGTGYQIYPSVAFKSAGHVTTNAVARALVNALASNAVYRVEMLEKGLGYDYYSTATVVANAVVGVQSPAELQVIGSPPGGHGYDAAQELYASRMEISVKLSNSEANTIPTTNKFSQIGLLRDPQFANVAVEANGITGVFLSGETAYKLAPYRVSSGSTVNLNSNVITVAALDQFNCGVNVGDMLYLVYEAETLYQLVNVSAITNTTSLVLSKNAYITATDVTVYKANPQLSGIIEGTNTSHIVFTTLEGVIAQGDLIVGAQSGAKTTANATVLNGVRKGFNTFVGMHSITGNIVSGSFTASEIVYQGNINTSNATLHSIVNNNSGTYMYFTNQHEPFVMVALNKIIGATSNATFSPITYNYPDIKYGTGEVLYLENINPVTRTANTSEQFQLIFEF